MGNVWSRPDESTIQNGLASEHGLTTGSHMGIYPPSPLGVLGANVGSYGPRPVNSWKESRLRVIGKSVDEMSINASVKSWAEPNECHYVWNRKVWALKKLRRGEAVGHYQCGWRDCEEAKQQSGSSLLLVLVASYNPRDCHIGAELNRCGTGTQTKMHAELKYTSKNGNVIY